MPIAIARDLLACQIGLVGMSNLQLAILRDEKGYPALGQLQETLFDQGLSDLTGPPVRVPGPLLDGQQARHRGGREARPGRGRGRRRRSSAEPLTPEAPALKWERLFELAGQLGWSMPAFWDATYSELCCAYDGLCRWHGTGRFARKKEKGGPWTSAEVARARTSLDRARHNQDRLPKPAIPDYWLKKLHRVNAGRRCKYGRPAPLNPEEGANAAVD